MKQILIILTLSLSTLWSQIPNGYYDSAAGQTGSALHQSLHDIIDNHNSVSYSSLWTHYQTTDVKPNGKVWDMYSDVPGGTPAYEFTFGSDQCGNYSGEGSCYNREHSWPKSWFNDNSPMSTDIFHVVPSDGYVNGQRSNYPYGEVANPTWTSTNGSKKGPNTYPGYSGTVFEPIDTYKGDFARIYFYMSTRYLNEDSSWPGSPMADGAQLEEWALNMMMEWHEADPVSQKEIDRNNDIYNYVQFNRNPFVDHPEYASYIWGEVAPLPVAPSDLEASNITETTMDLSWTDNASDEDGYYVYQNDTRIATLEMNATSHSFTELEPSTIYEFAVSAFNTAGESALTSTSVSTLGGGSGSVTHFLESFESWEGSGTGYFDGDIPLTSGIWNMYQSGNFSLGAPFTGDYNIAINDDTPGAQITTPAVDSLGTLSFYYYQRNGSEGDEFQIQKSINEGPFETIATQNYDVGETYTLFTLAVNDTSSAIKMRVLNDNQSAHLIIDDLEVTEFPQVSIVPTPELQPSFFSLSPAYPNPFNPSTTLNFQVGLERQNLTLEVFNLKGELVDTPAQGVYAPGSYNLIWDAADAQGNALPSGVYLLKLAGSGVSHFQRITLLR